MSDFCIVDLIVAVNSHGFGRNAAGEEDICTDEGLIT